MSVHTVSLILKGTDLNKYDDESLQKILNKGFKYKWYYGKEQAESFNNNTEINFCTETKNSNFGKILKAVRKLMPEVTEVYYHVKPYWTNGPSCEVDEETGKRSCFNYDDEIDYWTNDQEKKNKLYDNKRWAAVRLYPSRWLFKELFEKWDDDIDEVDSAIINTAYDATIGSKDCFGKFCTERYTGCGV